MLNNCLKLRTLFSKRSWVEHVCFERDLLFHRAKNICSTQDLFENKVRNLRQLFSKNGYPTSFFNRILENFLNQNNGASNQDLNSSISQGRKFFLTVPYLGKPSTTFFLNIRVLIKSKLDIEITPIFKTTKISSYFNIKSRTPSNLQSNVVYKYTCSRDVNVTYVPVGYSARHWITRAKEHISDCKSNKTVIKNHILNCNSCLNENSKFKLDRFSIMRKSNSAYEAKIHEALLIKKQNPTINKQLLKCMQMESPFY